MDTGILEMLEDIGRSATPRLSPSIPLSGETAEARRAEILRTIRGTILPRRLEYTSPDGHSLAIEVNSSRVTDVFGSSTGEVPDFETEAREVLTKKLAQLVSDMASAPGPLQMTSLRPDSALEADDVGITFSEIDAACADIALVGESQVSVVPERASEPEEAVAETRPTSSDKVAAQGFFDAAERFATGRILMQSAEKTVQCDGVCAAREAIHPDQDLLKNFAQDLAGWDADSATTLSHPQLIVMRPSGGQGAGLAVFRDGQNTAAVVHETRRLGAVVNLWKSVREAAQ